MAILQIVTKYPTKSISVPCLTIQTYKYRVCQDNGTSRESYFSSIVSFIFVMTVIMKKKWLITYHGLLLLLTWILFLFFFFSIFVEIARTSIKKLVVKKKLVYFISLGSSLKRFSLTKPNRLISRKKALFPLFFFTYMKIKVFFKNCKIT